MYFLGISVSLLNALLFKYLSNHSTRRKTASVQVSAKTDKNQEEFELESPSDGFLWKSPSYKWASAKIPNGDCQKVNVDCGNFQCGTRPAFELSGGTEGNAPWHVTLFANGRYLCGATLVHEKWAVVAASCFKNVE